MIQIDITMPKDCWTCPYYKTYYKSGRSEIVFAAKSQKGRKINNTWNLGYTRQKWCSIKECDSNDL